MTIYIRPDELIVGNQTTKPRAAPVFPEFAIQYLIDELDGKPWRPDARPGDSFQVTEKDEAILREIARWWRGKTVEEFKINLLPHDVHEAFKQVVFSINQGNSGGQAHFIADAATLRDAREHPEKYPNLLVRVAGYSALFTTLQPEVQDEIISTTKQSWW